MKFHGNIGYVISTENPDGTFTNEPSEVEASGDVSTFRRRWNDDSLNGDVLYTNTVVSVVLPPTASEWLPNIRYIYWRGVPWCVTSIEELPPRVNLTLGGVYNGPIVDRTKETS